METTLMDQMVEARRNFERYSYPYTLIGFLVSQEYHDKLRAELFSPPFSNLTIVLGLPITVSPNLPAHGKHIAPVLTTNHER